MLDRKTYFIREHVGLLKLKNCYDILDAESQEQLGVAVEDPGWAMHLLSLVVDRQRLPTTIQVFEGSDPKQHGEVLFSLKRGLTFLRSRVDILDASGSTVGWLQSKLMSLGGALRVFDASGDEVALVKGDWKGWNFRFLDADQNEIGTISKKWAGAGKELFTSADNYVVSLQDDAPAGHELLLLAAGLAIDTVFKEG